MNPFKMAHFRLRLSIDDIADDVLQAYVFLLRVGDQHHLCYCGRGNERIVRRKLKRDWLLVKEMVLPKIKLVTSHPYLFKIQSRLFVE